MYVIIYKKVVKLKKLFPEQRINGHIYKKIYNMREREREKYILYAIF